MTLEKLTADTNEMANVEQLTLDDTIFEAFTPVNRLQENKDLIAFLYEAVNDPKNERAFSQLRFGQLLLNATISDGFLYNVESAELKDILDEELSARHE